MARLYFILCARVCLFLSFPNSLQWKQLFVKPPKYHRDFFLHAVCCGPAQRCGRKSPPTCPFRLLDIVFSLLIHYTCERGPPQVRSATMARQDARHSGPTAACCISLLHPSTAPSISPQQQPLLPAGHSSACRLPSSTPLHAQRAKQQWWWRSVTCSTQPRVRPALKLPWWPQLERRVSACPTRPMPAVHGTAASQAPRARLLH